MILTQLDMPCLEPVPLDTRKFMGLGSGSRRWRFVDDWTFVLHNGNIAFVPRGFVFNGASIPKLFRSFMSPIGFLFIASVFHDFGYRFGYLRGWEEKIRGAPIKLEAFKTRTDFDFLLRDTAIQTSGWKGLSNTVFGVITSTGYVSWDKHRKNNVTEEEDLDV